MLWDKKSHNPTPNPFMSVLSYPPVGWERSQTLVGQGGSLFPAFS